VQLLRFAVLPLILVMLGTSSAVAGSVTVDHVRFESAAMPIGPLQQKQARERGEELKPAPGDLIDGYLARPEGTGPFPAVVHLHGCAGLGPPFKAHPGGSEWVTQLVSWGYVVLVVDSFTTRNVSEACTQNSYFAFKGGIETRELDAFGALRYLSRLGYVDSSRVAMLGFSMGGWTVLASGSPQASDLFDNPDRLAFKAAIAFYPLCTFVPGIMTIPTLILTGASDDWTIAKDCQAMMERRAGAGAPVDLVIYPGAYHAFDASILQPGLVLFGHRLEYNAEAATKATAATREFLARQLRR
jgi:dienelactone hydrolase